MNKFKKDHIDWVRKNDITQPPFAPTQEDVPNLWQGHTPSRDLRGNDREKELGSGPSR